MEKRGRMGVTAGTEPLYVCLYVPEFSAQALLRLRPELQRHPVAILAGNPPLEEVCSANAEAFRLGIVHGMTKAEVENVAGLHLLRRSEAEQRNAGNSLLEVAGRFTPRVEMCPCSNAFVMVLDMTGTERIFGAAPAMLAIVARAAASLRLSVQLAASANFHAAVCCAPAARKAPILLPRGMERERLSTLPLSALPLTPRQAETFEFWGLRTVGELASLPEDDLVSRLGQEGKRLRLLARGEHPHLMVPEEAAFALEEYIEFDSPVELLDSLLFVLSPMLEQLLVRAQSRALALASVTVRLGLDGGGEHERTIKPALPVAQREVLLKLLHLDLQAHPPSAGVVSVFVQAQPGDRSNVQLGLFAPQLPEPMRLDVTLARIAAVVGEDRVGRARLLDTHRPDSFVMERFTVTGSAPQTLGASRRISALRRCRPPRRLTMEFRDSRPAAFSLAGQRYMIREAYGPWRRSGEWWTSEVWAQEEWDVCATAGKDEALLCVLSHDLLHHQWQMDAVYD